MEAEKITIIEGPTPHFLPNSQLWNWAIYQTPDPTQVTYCEVRTLNGASIQERCTDAWNEGRRVVLEYPDDMRMRQEIDVIAMRLTDTDEGAILKLWLNAPQTEEIEANGFDDFDGFDFDDDGLNPF